MLNKTTILLTGVNGFLGNYLTAVLLKAGFTVVGIGKGNCRLTISHSSFQYYAIDVTNQYSLQQLFETTKPHIVIHAAANSKPDDCECNQEAAYKVNVQATKDLLLLSTKTKTKFIYLSTDFVFDGAQGLYKENDHSNPVNYYGYTKHLSEQFVSQYEYAYAIIRTVLVYGKPLQGRHNILSIIYDKLKNTESIRLVNDQFRTPTYIKDLAWGILQIVLQNKTGIWHLSGEQPLVSPYEMGQQLAEIYHFDPSLLIPVDHTTFKETAKRPCTTGLDIEKAKKELGFSPTPFRKAVREIFM